jgi:hypothetical protein
MRKRAKGTTGFSVEWSETDVTRMTCGEAECEARSKGWMMIFDPKVEMQQEFAQWIRGQSGREYYEGTTPGCLDWLVNNRDKLGINVTADLLQTLQNTPAGWDVFIFPPGQQCFKIHKDREVTFAATSAAGKRIHTRPLDFNEHMNEESGKYQRIKERG